MITPRERLGISVIIAAVLYAGIFLALGRVSWGADPFKDQIGPVFVDLQPDKELDAYLNAERPKPEPEKAAVTEKPALAQSRTEPATIKTEPSAVKPEPAATKPDMTRQEPVRPDNTGAEMAATKAQSGNSLPGAQNPANPYAAINPLAPWGSGNNNPYPYTAPLTPTRAQAKPSTDPAAARADTPGKPVNPPVDQPIELEPVTKTGITETASKTDIPDTAGLNSYELAVARETDIAKPAAAGTPVPAADVSEARETTTAVETKLAATASITGMETDTGSKPAGTAGADKVAVASEEKPKGLLGDALDKIKDALTRGKSAGSSDDTPQNRERDAGGTAITQGPFTISGIEQGGRKILNFADPAIPAHLKNSPHPEYFVTVKFIVLPDGFVRPGLDITRSSGDSLLDEAVRSAVSRWKFTPAPQADPKGVEVTVIYSLEKKSR